MDLVGSATRPPEDEGVHTQASQTDGASPSQNSQPTPIVVPVEPSPPQTHEEQHNSFIQQLFLPQGTNGIPPEDGYAVQFLALCQGLAASLPGLTEVPGMNPSSALAFAAGVRGPSEPGGERKRKKHSIGGEGEQAQATIGNDAAQTADKKRKKDAFVANDDGWQWRKYGEKIVKDTPHPRSYYKCSDTSCPARKTVELNQEGVLLNTEYKEKHNHTKPSHARAASRVPPKQGQARTKKQAPQPEADLPSGASTATDLSRPWSCSPTGAVAINSVALKEEHTSPVKGSRRQSAKGTYTSKQDNRDYGQDEQQEQGHTQPQQQQQQQQQQPQHTQRQRQRPQRHRPQQDQQQQEAQQLQQQHSLQGIPGLVPTPTGCLGTSSQQLMPVGGSDLNGRLKAAGLQAGDTKVEAVPYSRPILVGPDLSNWLRTTGAADHSSTQGNAKGDRVGGGQPPGSLVVLDDLGGWLKQQQQQQQATVRGVEERSRPGLRPNNRRSQTWAGQQQEGRAPAHTQANPAGVLKQQQEQEQSTPTAGQAQQGGPFGQVPQDDDAALGSPPALLRTVPRYLQGEDALHGGSPRGFQGLGALCSPPTLLRASAVTPGGTHAAHADTHGGHSMGLDVLHQGLVGPCSTAGLMGGGWSNLGSPPTLEGLGSMLKGGSGFMGRAEPASLHSLLCGSGSPAAYPPSAFRHSRGLYGGPFTPHRCDLNGFNSPHSMLPGSARFAPAHPSRLGEPSRATVTGLAPDHQPSQPPPQQPMAGECGEGEAPPGLGGLCSTPNIKGLLPCTPGTLLPGSSSYYGSLHGLHGLHGLDGSYRHGSLHCPPLNPLASPPLCLNGSHRAALAVGASDPWGALAGLMSSPGLAAPPTIPRGPGGEGCVGQGPSKSGAGAAGDGAAQKVMESPAGTGAVQALIWSPAGIHESGGNSAPAAAQSPGAGVDVAQGANAHGVSAPQAPFAEATAAPSDTTAPLLAGQLPNEEPPAAAAESCLHSTEAVGCVHAQKAQQQQQQQMCLSGAAMEQGAGEGKVSSTGRCDVHLSGQHHQQVPAHQACDDGVQAAPGPGVVAHTEAAKPAPAASCLAPLQGSEAVAGAGQATATHSNGPAGVAAARPDRVAGFDGTATGAAQRNGGSSRARSGREVQRGAPRTAASRALAQRAHTQTPQLQQQQEQPEGPGGTAAPAGAKPPACRSPRLDVLAACTGLARDAWPQPSNSSLCTPAIHAAANTKAGSNSISRVGVMSAAAPPAGAVPTPIATNGSTAGNSNTNNRTRSSRGTARTPQQQQQHRSLEQQDENRQQQLHHQRSSKRQHAEQSSTSVGPIPRGNRASAAGKAKAAKTVAGTSAGAAANANTAADVQGTLEALDAGVAAALHCTQAAVEVPGTQAADRKGAAAGARHTQQAAPAGAAHAVVRARQHPQQAPGLVAAAAADNQGLGHLALGDGFAVIRLAGAPKSCSAPEGDGFATIRLQGSLADAKGSDCRARPCQGDGHSEHLGVGVNTGEGSGAGDAGVLIDSTNGAGARKANRAKGAVGLVDSGDGAGAQAARKGNGGGGGGANKLGGRAMLMQPRSAGTERVDVALGGQESAKAQLADVFGHVAGTDAGGGTGVARNTRQRKSART